MVQYCCVPGCKNNALIPGISLHIIPRSEIIRKQWIVKIRRDEKKSKVSLSMRVCSEHFQTDDYVEGEKIKRLKKEAVPSVFSFTSQQKLETRKRSIVYENEIEKNESDYEPSSNSLNSLPDEITSDTEIEACEKIENIANSEQAMLKLKEENNLQRLKIGKPSQDSDNPDYTPDVSVFKQFETTAANPANNLIMKKDRHCFVPGCQSGYPKQRKDFKKSGKRIPSLFGVKMHDYEMLNLWRKAIPRADKEFNFGNRVCDLHFKKTDVQKNYVYKMPDGSVEKLQRGLPALKRGAIPSIFPKLPLHLSNKSQKRKTPPASHVPAPKKNKEEEGSTLDAAAPQDPEHLKGSQENESIESGRKKSRCHMCSREFLNFAKVLEHLKTKHAVWFRNMDYISCSIPGCKSKSHRKIDHNTAVEDENILMFPVPHADELFNKWKEALKGTNIELTRDDHICECHFLENDIERYHRTKTHDGNIIDIRKRLPTLKPDAVPVKYLKLKDYSKKLSILQNHSVISSESSITDKSSLADSSLSLISGQISHKKKCMSYNELVKSIQLVKKPSKYWSVVCTDQFAIFARWNNKFIPEKRLVIESSLIVRVFLKEWEIEMTDLVDLTSVDDVSSLLEKVENYTMDLAC